MGFEGPKPFFSRLLLPLLACAVPLSPARSIQRPAEKTSDHREASTKQAPPTQGPEEITTIIHGPCFFLYHSLGILYQGLQWHFKFGRQICSAPNAAVPKRRAFPVFPSPDSEPATLPIFPVVVNRFVNRHQHHERRFCTADRAALLALQCAGDAGAQRQPHLPGQDLQGPRPGEGAGDPRDGAGGDPRRHGRHSAAAGAHAADVLPVAVPGGLGGRRAHPEGRAAGRAPPDGRHLPNGLLGDDGVPPASCPPRPCGPSPRDQGEAARLSCVTRIA